MSDHQTMFAEFVQAVRDAQAVAERSMIPVLCIVWSMVPKKKRRPRHRRSGSKIRPRLRHCR